jgi:hypothetical protein
MTTLQQTVEIPPDHRLTLDVPWEVPSGKTILTFTPAPDRSASTNSSGLNLQPTVEEIAQARAGIGRIPFPPCCETLEEVLAAAEQRAEAEKADPSLRSLKAWHGIWEDSKVWGQHLDTNAIIREMRDGERELWNGNSLSDNNGKA